MKKNIKKNTTKPRQSWTFDEYTNAQQMSLWELDLQKIPFN